MKKLVGTYQLGYQDVELFVDTEVNGGSGIWNAGTHGKERPRIVIGIDCSLWYAWGTLVHEVMEWAVTNLGASYTPYLSFNARQTDSRTFMMSHKQFDEATQWCGSYLHECHSDFEKAYKKYAKKK